MTHNDIAQKNQVTRMLFGREHTPEEAWELYVHFRDANDFVDNSEAWDLPTMAAWYVGRDFDGPNDYMTGPDREALEALIIDYVRPRCAWALDGDRIDIEAWSEGKYHPRQLQRRIAASPEATKRVYAYLHKIGRWSPADAKPGEKLTVSGSTLASVCGVNPRVWRKWAGGEQSMPVSAQRLLVEVAGI